MRRVLVEKHEGKRPLRRPCCRWEDNIRMDLQEVGCGAMNCIELAQDRDRWQALVNAVKHLRFPYNAGNFLTGCKPVSFSRRTLFHGVSIKFDENSSCGCRIVIYGHRNGQTDKYVKGKKAHFANVRLTLTHNVLGEVSPMEYKR
jgi:hypothetical protein